jgi:hypothetical protein
VCYISHRITASRQNHNNLKAHISLLARISQTGRLALRSKDFEALREAIFVDSKALRDLFISVVSVDVVEGGIIIYLLSFLRLNCVIQPFSTFSKRASVMRSLWIGRCCLISATTGSTCSSRILLRKTPSVNHHRRHLNTSMLIVHLGSNGKSLDQVLRTITTPRSPRSFRRL